MCGIAGFSSFGRTFENPYWGRIAKIMGDTLTHRGPDSDGVWQGDHAVFAHSRLAVIDPEGGKQPMKREMDGFEYVITYNGELYNTKELKRELIQDGCEFTTASDTEVLLQAYMRYGKSCIYLLNGMYAFAIWDGKKQELFACRDRFGVKPFFYAQRNGVFVFGSEIKALFEYPGIEPVIDRNGLNEIFGIGPARSFGSGVFQGIKELPAGHYLIYGREGLRVSNYYTLKSRIHTDNEEDTADHVRYLLKDSIRRQLVSDVPICTFLSGGLDSSMITAVAAEQMQEQGRILDTYSFDYIDNDQYSKQSAYQLGYDVPYVEKAVEAFHTNHTKLFLDSRDLADQLPSVVTYKDLPGMADIDSSLLGFCRLVKNQHTVAISGECADDIFGGYPWFFEDDMMNAKTFPWAHDLTIRKRMISKEILPKLDLDGYVENQYLGFLSTLPEFPFESEAEARRREIGYLSLYWFMATLLERNDRMSMASGVEVRFPFCDHRLISYVWNIPWEMKAPGGERKHILREAARGIVPEEVRLRPQSSYPKTHHPAYETLVKQQLFTILNDPTSPILDLVDKDELMLLCAQNFDDKKPWFGQLMAGPQMIAYLIQINYWLKTYQVKIQL